MIFVIPQPTLRLSNVILMEKLFTAFGREGRSSVAAMNYWLQADCPVLKTEALPDASWRSQMFY
jgi:hypothetical protein